MMREINSPSNFTSDSIRKYKPMVYAEIGSNFGNTTISVIEAMQAGSELHLFDYGDYIEKTKSKIALAATADAHFRRSGVARSS